MTVHFVGAGPGAADLITLRAASLLAAADVDRVFGAKTKAAVMEFQRRNKLDVDGLVGPVTLEKMGL